ncbi:hypothetical protein K8B33_11450 [Alcanivorax sp. JB21]|uniref:hypothetical protein n=1 Tax=Alcanivorax limicola TaxID=2874102 RepID=UPI001CBD5F9D|nr:hypothetical protein [Alcanivorax limicola]MBZ2189716.1 hypothetical protein [Alcanivorax limicola]
MKRLLTRNVTILFAALALAACNNDTGGTALPGDHDHDHGDAAGRLVFSHAAGSNSRVYVYDLHEEAMLDDFALSHPANAVYPSPGGRYALVMHRDNDQVSILDSGLWWHGDHPHVDPPVLLPLTLDGVRPTHYRYNGDHGAVFHDGDHDAGLMASFDLFTDASLSQGGVVASRTLTSAHHGVAEPLSGWVLASDAESGESASGIRLFEVHGDHFHNEGLLPEACPGLHGGATHSVYSVFGCSDGVLIVERLGNDFEATRLDEPAEGISIVYGHEDLPLFVGFSWPALNLYTIDPVGETVELVDWRNGAVNGDDDPVAAVYTAMGLDAHGEHLVVLDETGHVHVVDTATWTHQGSVKLLDQVPAGALAPVLTFSRLGGVAYLTDPADQRILALDLETLSHDVVVDELGFAPVGLAWTGFEDDHDHHHDHDH